MASRNRKESLDCQPLINCVLNFHGLSMGMVMTESDDFIKEAKAHLIKVVGIDKDQAEKIAKDIEILCKDLEALKDDYKKDQ